METITVTSARREEMIDITRKAAECVEKSGVADGICVLFIQHTTCGMTVNENADPSVQSDMLGFLRKLIPQYFSDFRHSEHNSDAHIKSSLVGSSVTIPFAGGELMLGRWQAIYMCEFDGPRERLIAVAIK
ncbi:MAG TPA: secondary thiamine-phosphate synthase enzyme YjbQ [Pyrinomonadaceae bacterium]|nr:secondary thiamine-phosphate synthase enzyme YjbQ [Pyrinomonadaceae bacterium]